MADAKTNYKGLDYDRMGAMLNAAKDDVALFAAIVNTPFEFKAETAFLFLGITVLLQVNKKTGMIDRIALSNTDLAKSTISVTSVPFNEIKIPLDSQENIIAQAIRSGQPHDTTDWNFIFTPALTAEEARINQASAGIAYSAVYPLKSRDGGAIIFSYFQYEHNIGEAQREFMQRYVVLADKALQY